jgi:hypothetical protein
VTLPFAATKVTAGLPFTAQIQTLPLVAETQKGVNVGKPSSVSRIAMRLLESRGVKAGPRADQLETVRPRLGELPGEPNRLLSGIFELNTQARITDEPSVVVQSDDPLPFTCLGVFIDPVVSG